MRMLGSVYVRLFWAHSTPVPPRKNLDVTLSSPTKTKAGNDVEKMIVKHSNKRFSGGISAQEGGAGKQKSSRAMGDAQGFWIEGGGLPQNFFDWWVKSHFFENRVISYIL